MTWFLLALAATYVLGAVRLIAQVGKPRSAEPTRGPVVAGTVLIEAGIVTGLVLIALGVWR